MLLWFCLWRLKGPLGFCGAHSYWLKEVNCGPIEVIWEPFNVVWGLSRFQFCQIWTSLGQKGHLKAYWNYQSSQWGCLRLLHWDHMGHNMVIWDLLRAFGGILWSFVGPIKSLSCWIRLYCVSKSPFKALWKQIKWILGLKRCFIGGRRSLVDPMRLFESPVFSHGAC